MPEIESGSERSIIELPNFSLLSVWPEGVSLQNKFGDWIYGYRLFYSIVDRFDKKVVSRALLSDFSDVKKDIFEEDDNLLYQANDLEHFVAVDSNGNIGIVWRRYQQTWNSYFNYNIHFAIIDELGTIVVPDTNITQEENFYYYVSNDYINFDSPQIAATESGGFFLAWRTETWFDTNPYRKVNYALVDASGSIGEISEVTDSTIEIFNLNNLSMTALSRDRIFISWYQLPHYEWDNRYYTAYKVFDGSGNILVEETDLGLPGDFDHNQPPPCLAQLSDGTIIMVSWNYSAPVKFILIDDKSYERSPEHAFALLPGFMGDKFPSVTTDMEGHAIITWMSQSLEKGKLHLVYALVSSDGTVVSEPFAFYSPGLDRYNQYSLGTNTNRQGNTTYHKNTPPWFTSTPVTSVLQGELYSYDIEADDYDLDLGDSLTFAYAETIPSWLGLLNHGDNTATLSGTPGNVDVGEHPVTLVVTDSTNKSKTQSFTLTVINVNDPPMFTSEPVTTVDEGSLYQYNITADDPDLLHDDDTLTITATTKPPWLELTDNGDGTALLFGTPQNADVGVHPVVLRVTDSADEFETQSFTITVSAYYEAPMITSEASVTFMVGEDDTEFTVETTGKPTPAISIVGAFPGGVGYVDNDDGTATISGIPEPETGGIYPLTITASNGVDPAANQEFNLIVATAVVVDGAEGEIYSSAGDILITIPEGAVPGEATFTFVPQTEPYMSPGSLSFAGISFRLSAGDNQGNPITKFDEPLIIKITYDPDALGGIDPETLYLYTWDDTAGEWVDAVCEEGEYTRNMDEHWFSLPICHLSQFAVMGEASTGYNLYLPLIRR